MNMNVYFAPGRVNLIGEHTDYNDGFVLPFALAQGVTVRGSARTDGVLDVRSAQAAGSLTAQVSELKPGHVSGWAAYVAGVAWALRAADYKIGGATLRIDSDLAQGAGLSSSAALECSVALALCDLYGFDVARPELARICQRAENDFVGMPCGIMDQSASLLCTAGHALLLDCRSGLSAQVPLAIDGLTLLIIDTRASHELVVGEYAARRRQCEEAAAALGAPALRDVTDLADALSRLDDDVLHRRVQHVVTDNHRVEATVGLLRSGQMAEIGALLTASHLSLRDQFEISWPEADVAVEAAIRAGARGGRMVGGGFGGSAIALVPDDRLAAVREDIATAYAARGWTAPEFLEAVPGEGARRVA